MVTVELLPELWGCPDSVHHAHHLNPCDHVHVHRNQPTGADR